MADVCIAVGSNILPEENIKKALLLLKERMIVKEVSPFYRTKPLLDRDDGDYYNGVFFGQTDLGPALFKDDVLRSVENALGRIRSEDKYAPRSIDLDLILYDDLVAPELKIPDPDIYTRPFISVPLSQICPTVIIPDREIAIKEVFDQADREGLFFLEEFTGQLRKIITG